MHESMILNRVVLGVEIAQVDLSRRPVKIELALGAAILEPVEPHVHTFRFLGFARSVDDSLGCGIVGADGSGRLAVT